jgi:hypothetical protein
MTEVSTVGIAALHELRVARRKRRLADLHWVDTMYRLYVVVLAMGAGLWWLSSLLGRSPLSEETRVRLDRDGIWIGAVVVGLAMLLAVRSGKRGGPLASEGADVVHVLSAPLDRSAVLARPFFHVVRRGALLGAVSGTIFGEILAWSFPGSRLSWLLRGALLGVIAGLSWMCVAIACSGRKRPRQIIAAVIVGLAVFSAIEGYLHRSSPAGGSSSRLTVGPLTAFVWGAFLGQPANDIGLSRPPVWSMVVGGSLLLGLIVSIFLTARKALGDIDMERAARRAGLVGQLRFAVSTQDLRTVLLLRRQLGDERPRRQPYVKVGQPVRGGLTVAVMVRSVRGMARWPLNRFVRVISLGLVSAGAAVAGWRGAVVFFLFTGLGAFVAGLDVVESIGQDIDHPTLPAGMPRHRGRLMNRQLIAPVIVLMVLGLPGAILGAVLEWGGGSGAVAAGLLLLCWSAGGAIGGGVSTVMGPPPFALSIQSPESAFLLASFPAMISTLSVSGPLLSAHLAEKSGSISDGFSRAVPPVFLLMYLGIVVITSKGEPDRTTPRR